ncbi:MAG: hypothetical protein AYK19_16440 [Theionarchaea archaeon DG-70-1]|nr:MAG: hypothetical protein AYK19_16440 [Theionarchaea archaeon DG-70-1]
MNASSYEKEQERREEEIWSLIQVEHAVVIDCGIGKNAVSTRALIDKGDRVITIDKDREALFNHKDLPIQLVQCDITDMPFKPDAADAALFYFTLHEIDPVSHGKIISEIGRIVSRIIIVEPSPGGNAAYQRFEELWREAMHAVGKFEDYQVRSYWEKLLQINGFKIVVSKSISHEMDIPPEKIEELRELTVKTFKEEGVPEKYIDEMNVFLRYAQKVGMKFYDISVVIGKSMI